MVWQRPSPQWAEQIQQLIPILPQEVNLITWSLRKNDPVRLHFCPPMLEGSLGPGWDLCIEASPSFPLLLCSAREKDAILISECPGLPDQTSEPYWPNEMPTTHFASKSPSSPFGGTPKGIVFPKIGVSHDYIIQHSALPPILGNGIFLHLSWMRDWLFKLLLCLSTGTVPGSAPWEGSFGSVISELYPRAAYLAQKSYESPLF